MERTERTGGFTSDDRPVARVTVELHLTPRYSAEAVEAGEFSGSLVGGVHVVTEVRPDWPSDRGTVIEEVIRQLLGDLRIASSVQPGASDQ